MKLYENVVIGNFLFDLGVRMAKLRPDLPLISVSLLQRTPADGWYGDILLANAGVCRLIEFKRAGCVTKKELRKLKALRHGIENSGSRELAAHVSRSLHWYAEIKDPSETGDVVECSVCPYLDFQANPTFTRMSDFAARAAADACEQEPDLTVQQNRREYLRFVCEHFSAIDAEFDAQQTAQAGSSPVFLIAINNKGETYWLAAPRMEYIMMTSHELERALELDVGRGGEEHDRTRDYDHSHGMDHGYGR